MKKLLLSLLLVMTFIGYSQNGNDKVHGNKKQDTTSNSMEESRIESIIDPGGGGAYTWWRDHDLDGYGDPNFSTDSDTQPYGYAPNDDDCNDFDADVNPAEIEVMDGKDNDCDGQIDEGLSQGYLPKSESFETSFGQWLQDTSDDIDWKRDSGGTPSSSTGPTTGDAGSYYLFLEASGYSNKTGRLKSPLFSIPNNFQIEFGYHMYGADMGSLNVEVSTNGINWSLLWSKSGDQGNNWHTAKVDLSVYGGSNIYLRFRGVTGGGYRSDISIDNIRSSIGSVAIQPEDESWDADYGGWIQDTSDDFDWIRHSNSTTSSGTGPSGAQEGVNYLYAEASSPNYPSKVSNITSPLYAMPTPGLSLEFQYHMYGGNMGTLNLFISTNNGSTWSQIWSKSGDQGNQWLSADVNLSAYEGQDFKLRFQAITGDNFASDIAIDNLNFVTQISCGDGVLLSDTENYVYSRTYREAKTVSPIAPSREEIIEEVTYFDGLGRPKQHVGIGQAEGTGYGDVVTHIPYDDFGRKMEEYLPVPLSDCASGSYRSGNIENDTRVYYNNTFGTDFSGISTANPYSKKEFDGSPLNRVTKQAAPGEAWKLGGGHEIEFDYQSNSTNEVRRYDVSLIKSNGLYHPTLVINGYYTSGTLYKTVTYDENNNNKATAHSTEEFKDKQGNVVLKRTYKGSTKYDTYYVYDAYGNLTYVLPPKSEPTSAKPDVTELNELCYQYKYDGKNRLVEKKIPGKGWEYIVYNKLDQPVMTQDAKLDASNQWLFTKYDALGRVAYTGLKNINKTRADYQALVDNGTYSKDYVARSGANSYASTTVYYSNEAIPTSMDEIYTVNYYDNYTNLNAGLPSTNSYGVSIETGSITKGLPTMTKVRVLETNQWITTTMGYDDKGRLIWSKSTNPFLGTTDIMESELHDFNGNVERVTTTHQKSGQPTIVTEDVFEYDHMNRLVKHTQSINGGNTELIAENRYDELGQLIKKGVGNIASSSTRLQEIDYTYNVRGWLTAINDISNTNKLFNFKLSYNNPSSGTALFNGNISRTDWRTDNTDSNLKYYKYYYDDLNRITSATAHSSNYNVSGITYDKNGNILTLTRRGAINSSASSFGDMDKLVYSYDPYSNKLVKVADGASIDSYGFKDDALNATSDSSNDYGYDINGNLTSDANKGISSINYNHLGLPKSIGFSSQMAAINYTYDALGNKLKKRVSGSGMTTIETIYAGKFVYKGGDLEFFNHPEGYVSNENGIYSYVYNYTDHLGNVRLSYSDANGNGNIDVTSDPATTEIIQEQNYYPFGLTHSGYNSIFRSSGSDVAKMFKYNNVELEESLGLNLYEMEQRYYDASIGRWNSIDPVIHFSTSTYNSFDNNPIFWSDPSGADSVNGESVGADGLTNSQWIRLSRPGGGGLDAMRKQARANSKKISDTKKESSLVVGELQDYVKEALKFYEDIESYMDKRAAYMAERLVLDKKGYDNLSTKIVKEHEINQRLDKSYAKSRRGGGSSTWRGWRVSMSLGEVSFDISYSSGLNVSNHTMPNSVSPAGGYFSGSVGYAIDFTEGSNRAYTGSLYFDNSTDREVLYKQLFKTKYQSYIQEFNQIYKNGPNPSFRKIDKDSL